MQRVKSTQKLPTVLAERRAKPRMSAMASAMPVALRIEGKHCLEALQRVERNEAGNAEEQHGDDVGHPVLLVLLVDPRNRIDGALDRPEQWREDGPLAGEDFGHVGAERLHEQRYQQAVERDLYPAVECHDEALLKPLGPDERVNEIGENEQRDGAAKDEIEHDGPHKRSQTKT